ncbi:TPA: type II toxin-antitoxin system HicB family antitoxin [Escherichia coli]|uniref:type II toxin-antitoxin system HicB family antitoxin n=1 Tax=Escherichia coli TaxID=562 RepID=UPI00063D25FD|nr:type II toxin-antitoxin system HicB family antitoxin [Escherichia coli]EKF4269552.1 type II toxin-antitoxin system HicB family antitoxin [Escherichia coli O113]EKK2982277.1 type II toxin-antitoxin system HicB family antitoxin [Escherichia coli O153]HDQ6611408.1 type II toxin-antitoxin system HicB family antitoxin [Escherichia coli Ou:H21]HDQ6716413.1 type II toxin-antitoxin system HicB family antitoxin [Escherichia coli O113:H4]HDQ6747326.1 type II toxin-antitoxin system HicB family antitox
MFFSVGVETPKDDQIAYGITVPAFDRFDFGCVSAADSQAEIPVMAREAILAIVEEMVLSGAHSLDDIHDEGYLAYSDNINYSHCDSWFVIDVDLSEVEGKQQRINISLPDILIRRIDGYVKESGGVYKDRSHFLAQAARHELTYK